MLFSLHVIVNSVSSYFRLMSCVTFYSVLVLIFILQIMFASTILWNILVTMLTHYNKFFALPRFMGKTHDYASPHMNDGSFRTWLTLLSRYMSKLILVSNLGCLFLQWRCQPFWISSLWSCSATLYSFHISDTPLCRYYQFLTFCY